MPEQVIVDGASLYAGHRLAWRRGVIEHPGLTHGFPMVRLERRGRERVRPLVTLHHTFLLPRTPALELTLALQGLLQGRDDAQEPTHDAAVVMVDVRRAQQGIAEARENMRRTRGEGCDMGEPWQEFECPQCHVDWDHDPPLLAEGDRVDCLSCGFTFEVADNNCRTARIGPHGLIELPLPPHRESGLG